MKLWPKRDGGSEVAAAPGRRPRVLLIGTSNAVMASGYARVLSAYEGFETFENRSIGLSSSGLFALQRPGLDFSRYDICILDFSPNDAALERCGFLSANAIRAQLEEALAVIEGAGCWPVLLIYPIAGAMPDGGGAAAVVRSLAATYRVPLLDGYAFLVRTVGDPLPQTLFTDPMHLRPWVAREIGRQLAQGLAAQWTKPRAQPVEQHVAGFTHRFLDGEALAAACGVSPTVRRSRLLSIACADLAEGDYPIAVSPGEQVVAVAADVGLSACSLEVGGLASGHVRLSTEHLRRDGSRFVLGLWPIAPFVDAPEGTVTLSVRPDAMLGTLAGFGAPAEPPYRACLAGLVLRKPAMLLLRPVMPAALDLAAEIDPAVLEAMHEVDRIDALSRIVDGLYRGILDRPPDETGLDAYVESLRGRPLADGILDVCRSLVTSEEFARRDRLTGE